FGKERPDGAQWLLHTTDSSAERLLRFAAAGALEEGTAESLMTPIPLTVPETATLGDAIALMSENRLHHVIVLSPDALVVGLLSALDVVDIIAKANAARA